MRSIRTIVLAALVATAALAVIGVGTASADKATVLCKVNIEVCKGANVAGYAFNSSASEAKFAFGESGKFQCTSQMNRNESEQISTLSFSSCTEGCAVTAGGLPASGDMYQPIAGNGKMTLWLSGLSVKCGTAECAYSGTVTDLLVEGGTPVVVHVNKALAEKGGNPLCPNSVQWEADYKFTTPSAATYVTERGAEGPLFCSVNEAPCPHEFVKLYNDFPLATGSEMVFGKVPGGSNITCKGGGFSLNNLEPYVANGTWNYKPWGYWNCISSIYTACEFNSPNPPFGGKLTPTGGGNGTITVSAIVAGAPQFSLTCKSSGTPFTCTYAAAPSFSVKFTGGKPASLSNTISLVRVSGSATFCSSAATMVASYEAAGEARYMQSS